MLRWCNSRQLDTWLRKYKEAEASGANLVEIFIDTRGAVAGAGVKSLDDKMKEVAIAYFVKDSIINISEIYLILSISLESFYHPMMSSIDFIKIGKRKITFIWVCKVPDSAKISICLLLEMLVKQNIKITIGSSNSTPVDIICADEDSSPQQLMSIQESLYFM